MTEKLIGTYSFVFNPHDNGGEELILKTDFYDQGDGTIIYNQTLKLQSYCNAAYFELYGAAISPQKLRELANQLDEIYSKLNTNNS